METSGQPDVDLAHGNGGRKEKKKEREGGGEREGREGQGEEQGDGGGGGALKNPEPATSTLARIGRKNSKVHANRARRCVHKHAESQVCHVSKLLTHA